MKKYKVKFIGNVVDSFAEKIVYVLAEDETAAVEKAKAELSYLGWYDCVVCEVEA